MVVGGLRLLAYVISKPIWRIKYRGKENIPTPNGHGLLIAANHATYVDPAWIGVSIKQKLRFMAWDQAFEWRLIGRLIRYLGAFPVQHGKTVTKSAIVEAMRALKDGAALLVFPEGGREFADGRMLEFKTGAVHLALNAGVPILPVTIRGGNAIWPRNQKYPRLFRRVEVIFHPIIEIAERPKTVDLDEYLETLNQRLVGIISSEM